MNKMIFANGLEVSCLSVLMENVDQTMMVHLPGDTMKISELEDLLANAEALKTIKNRNEHAMQAVPKLVDGKPVFGDDNYQIFEQVESVAEDVFEGYTQALGFGKTVVQTTTGTDEEQIYFKL
ncbi:MAG: hypothetical protein ACK5L3_05425, partial [Oscillospiraceae bacterium]